MAMVRTNVTLPEDLMRQVDELAGSRGRSAFVADAVAQKVKREKLRRAIEETRGALVGTPDYMTPEESYRWVREQREIGNDEEDA
jgi:metal-responsive CopG/Arc/MetJ family transcriptional regulator